LALAVTFSYFVVALLFPVLLRLLPGNPQSSEQSSESEHD
jgi:hypothetical protein